MQVKFENLGTVNTNMVTVNGLQIVFSYETPVAFSQGFGYWIVRENDWSKTTGKLLNKYEPEKKKRITGEEFEKQLDEVLNNPIKI